MGLPGLPGALRVVRRSAGPGQSERASCGPAVCHTERGEETRREEPGEEVVVLGRRGRGALAKKAFEGLLARRQEGAIIPPRSTSRGRMVPGGAAPAPARRRAWKLVRCRHDRARPQEKEEEEKDASRCGHNDGFVVAVSVLDCKHLWVGNCGALLRPGRASIELVVLCRSGQELLKFVCGPRLRLLGVRLCVSGRRVVVWGPEGRKAAALIDLLQISWQDPVFLLVRVAKFGLRRRATHAPSSRFSILALLSSFSWSFLLVG
ncbi:hypothetical protein AXG93_2912s1490 [Marchantia polymorpha subsp. ruderalis]|uniref:Uncharacterized protein n=1 Tax=Marchantia polymorpha subsp. ruderalis TaxID=1480154 RepID=A0A176WGF4_MARPO|nr:hypothetical protein AXG93_2912s1490 [Marchantia polymorpha subsp. ruderalis]